MRRYWLAWSVFCVVMQVLYVVDGKPSHAMAFLALFLFCQAVVQIIDAIRAPRETTIKIITPEKDAV